MSSESTELSSLNVRELVRWLGPQGAKAGLLQSKLVTVELLTALATSMGLSLAKSATRQQLADEIVRVANKRIDKPVEELYQMSEDDLKTYFQRVEPTSEELLDLLRGLDLKPRKEGHRGLIEIAARELSETGRFLRISSSSGTPDGNGKR